MKQKVISFQEDGQKRKMVIKIEFTPLISHSPDPDRKIFSFKKGFKKYMAIKGRERGISEEVVTWEGKGTERNIK